MTFPKTGRKRNIRARERRNNRSQEHLAAPFAEALEAWTQQLRLRKCSPKTLEIRTRSVLDLFSSLAASGIERLSDVTGEDLDRHAERLIERGLKVNSRDIYLRSIRGFFNFLEETRRLFVNPAETLVIPKPDRHMLPVPTEAEMKRLLAVPNALKAVGLRDRALLEVMYSTGARRGEALGMTLFDPDCDRGTIRVRGKGRKERVLPLGRHALHWLRQYMREARPKLVKDRVDERALWVSKDGQPLSGIRVDQMIREHVRHAGIRKNISAHSLRRACVTHMLAHGAHPVQLQMLLGHASLQTLSQYLQVGLREMMNTHGATNPGR